MVTVSSDYRTSMDAPLRNPGHIRLIFRPGGVSTTLTEDYLTTSTLRQFTDPELKTFPQIDFTATLINFDDQIEEILTTPPSKGTEVNVQYGYELDDGTTEWLTAWELVCQEYRAEADYAYLTLTDRFRPVTQTYKAAAAYTSALTVADVLNDICSQLRTATHSSTVTWTSSEALSTLKYRGRLPDGEPLRDALMAVAGAFTLEIFLTRSGNFILETPGVGLIPDPNMFEINDDRMTSYMRETESPGVGTLTTHVSDYDYASRATTEKTAEGSFTASATGDTFRIDMGQPVLSVTITGTGYTASAVGNSVLLTATAAGTITYSVSATCQEIGTLDCVAPLSASSDVTDDDEVTNEYAYHDTSWSFPENYLDLRNGMVYYEWEDRGFPELDCGDTITSPATEFHYPAYAALVEQTFTFGTSFSASCKAAQLDDYSQIYEHGTMTVSEHPTETSGSSVTTLDVSDGASLEGVVTVNGHYLSGHDGQYELIDESSAYSSILCPGFLTASKQVAVFSVQLPHFVEDITSLNALVIRIAGVAGELLAMTDVLSSSSGYTVTYALCGDGRTLTIKVDKGSAYSSSAVNNSPITVVVYKLRFTETL